MFLPRQTKDAIPPLARIDRLGWRAQLDLGFIFGTLEGTDLEVFPGCEMRKGFDPRARILGFIIRYRHMPSMQPLIIGAVSDYIGCWTEQIPKLAQSSDKIRRHGIDARVADHGKDHVRDLPVLSSALIMLAGILSMFAAAADERRLNSPISDQLKHRRRAMPKLRSKLNYIS